MKKVWNSFLISFAMFSKIPVPRADWDKENMKYMICFFPAIGVIIGLLEWGYGWVAMKLDFGSLMRAAGFVLIPLIVTGGIHLDGFLDTVDALILTGGEDVDPSYYNEAPDPMLEEPNPARDTSDYWMMTAALDEDFPTLATCRGMQVMNVVCGGTLYQDLPTQFDSDVQHRDPELVDFTYHDVTIEDGSLLAQIMGAGKLNVNSWHHQGVKTVGEGLTVTARSDDGLVEALEMQDKTFMLGVQFHPEWRVVEGDDSFLPFFTALMDAAK